MSSFSLCHLLTLRLRDPKYNETWPSKVKITTGLKTMISLPHHRKKHKASLIIQIYSKQLSGIIFLKYWSSHINIRSTFSKGSIFSVGLCDAAFFCLFSPFPFWHLNVNFFLQSPFLFSQLDCIPSPGNKCHFYSQGSKIYTLAQTSLSTKLISNCLFTISTWMFQRHLKLNLSNSENFKPAFLLSFSPL